MTALTDLCATYTDPHAAARAFKAGGGQVAGYIGSDVLEELILAAGMLPVRLRAETGAPDTPADRYGEGGGNAIIRAFIARLLDGTYAYLDHLVVATTPSYLGALFTFLREIQLTDPTFPRLSLQLCDFHHGRTPSTARYNLDSLSRLKAALEGWSGQPIPDAAIRGAIATCNASRRALAELQALRTARRVSGLQALQLIGTAYMTPKAEHAAQLVAALAEAGPALPGRPVVFSGSDIETPDIYRRIEAQGLLIVADDHGWGSRVTERLVDETGDPLEALERRYRDMAPAPAKSSIAARVDYLLDLANRTNAEAVVFAIRGLDHPAAWDVPAQVEALTAAGVRTIQLDPAVFAGAPVGDILEAADGRT